MTYRRTVAIGTCILIVPSDICDLQVRSPCPSRGAATRYTHVCTLGKIGANDCEIRCDLRTIDLPLSQKPCTNCPKIAGYCRQQNLLAEFKKIFIFVLKHFLIAKPHSFFKSSTNSKIFFNKFSVHILMELYHLIIVILEIGH